MFRIAGLQQRPFTLAKSSPHHPLPAPPKRHNPQLPRSRGRAAPAASRRVGRRSPPDCAPDIAGKDIANPSALILAAAMLLNHLGETKAADRIYKAIQDTLKNPNEVTRDLNPKSNVGTKQFAEFIIQHIKSN